MIRAIADQDCSISSEAVTTYENLLRRFTMKKLFIRTFPSPTTSVLWKACTTTAPPVEVQGLDSVPLNLLKSRCTLRWICKVQVSWLATQQNGETDRNGRPLKPQGGRVRESRPKSKLPQPLESRMGLSTLRKSRPIPCALRPAMSALSPKESNKTSTKSASKYVYTHSILW